MNIHYHKYCIEIKRNNQIGDNINIQIQNDCSQIRIKDDFISMYLNIDKKELEIIRDAINEVLTLTTY